MVTGLHGIKWGLGKCRQRRGRLPAISQQGPMESADSTMEASGASCSEGQQMEGVCAAGASWPDPVGLWALTACLTPSVAQFHALFLLCMEGPAVT